MDCLKYYVCLHVNQLRGNVIRSYRNNHTHKLIHKAHLPTYNNVRYHILTATKTKVFIYLQATWTVAGWLLAFPRADHARHSHLNGPLPKYSYTMSLETVADTSCSGTPVCGSTCDSCEDGTNGCELPLHLNVSYAFRWLEQKGWKGKYRQPNELVKVVTRCSWVGIRYGCLISEINSNHTRAYEAQTQTRKRLIVVFQE